MAGETDKHSIRDRIGEFYRRLAVLPRMDSADAAFKQLCDTLDAVEDALSGTEKQTPPPSPVANDGRMYCPLDDHVLIREDGSILALTRGHRIEISAEGGVRISNRVNGLVEFQK